VVAKVEWQSGELSPRVRVIVTNMTRGAEQVVAFYSHRGTADQWKEGKNAGTWSRPSCHRFAANAVQLQLYVLADNLANFLRTWRCRSPSSMGRLRRCVTGW
jgi:Transposase DDE domain group 1